MGEQVTDVGRVKMTLVDVRAKADGSLPGHPNPGGLPGEGPNEHIRNALQLLDGIGEVREAVEARLHEALVMLEGRRNPAQYRHQRLRDPKEFDPQSFRTIHSGDHAIVVGCPMGKYRGGRCQVGLVAQAVLHPKGERNPCDNPVLALVNPYRVGPVTAADRGRLMATGVYEVAYKHHDDGADYVHQFEEWDQVRLSVLDDHRVLLFSEKVPIIGMFEVEG